MSQYRAPLAEMQFVMTELAGLGEIAKLPGFEDATPETVAAILEEADKFATGVLDPLNRIGDQQGRGRPTVREAHVAEHPWSQEIAGVGDDRAGANGPGILVETVVGEVESPPPTVIRFILKPDLRSLARAALGLPLTCGFQIKRFRNIEGEIDRIERIDGGQQSASSTGTSAVDDIPGIDPAVRDSAVAKAGLCSHRFGRR